MSASTKLSTAVKAICFLAESYPEPKSSKLIAHRIGANASKIRQLLSLLAKSNVVDSTQGKAGGFILKKDPSLIHLQEIYCSVEDRKALHFDVNKTNGDVVNETERFNNYFLDLFGDVQIEIENKMKQIFVISVMESIGIKSSYAIKNSKPTLK